MKFLSNTIDPETPNLEQHLIVAKEETPEEAVRHFKEWLAGKVIGEPHATQKYTVEELKAMGMVGVYTTK